MKSIKIVLLGLLFASSHFATADCEKYNNFGDCLVKYKGQWILDREYPTGRMPFGGPEDDHGSEAACLKDPYVDSLWTNSLGMGKGDMDGELTQKRKDAFDRTKTKSQAFILSSCLGVLTREVHRSLKAFQENRMGPGDHTKEIENLKKVKDAALDAEIALNNKFQLTMNPYSGIGNRVNANASK